MSDLKHGRAAHAPRRSAAAVHSRAGLTPAFNHGLLPGKRGYSAQEGTFSRDVGVSEALATRWWKSFANRLRATDGAAVAVSLASAYLWRFGSDASTSAGDDFEAEYFAVSILLLAAWIAVLEIFRTRDRRTFGVGGAEYKRVIQATLKLFSAVAIAMVFIRFDVVRGYFAVALPLGLVLLTVNRWLWRRWLNSKRLGGSCLSRVAVIGDLPDVEYIVRQLEKNPSAGYEVAGVGLPNVDEALTRRQPWHRIAVVTTSADVARLVEAARADAVIVAGHVPGGSTNIRELGWKLEATGTELVLASSLTNVAGPRIHFRPVDGLPLVHVELPQYAGGKHVLKRAIDVLISSLALVALLPLMIFLAIVVKQDSPGPVLFRQLRAGKNGVPFEMLKFRSMVATAETDLGSLRELNEASGPLFKIQNDPRITRCGRWMRKHSLDELPQFWNALIGEMSLVGPRPPLLSEVERYEEFTNRRLLIKPGITGLWQVNGRSALPWEESIRLDLYYVENWSLTGDLLILWRTFRAIRNPVGAC